MMARGWCWCPPQLFPLPLRYNLFQNLELTTSAKWWPVSLRSPSTSSVLGHRYVPRSSASVPWVPVTTRSSRSHPAEPSPWPHTHLLTSYLLVSQLPRGVPHQQESPTNRSPQSLCSAWNTLYLWDLCATTVFEYLASGNVHGHTF